MAPGPEIVAVIRQALMEGAGADNVPVGYSLFANIDASCLLRKTADTPQRKD
ncbi:hypothetical protein [Komagataeibacter kakiaceti]|uniref:hypothetical protein n=1 Tax=Komagataeibacter kakiaceti TaxID=943261 RepID=UPI00131F2EAC|nr:hypothetical protein [Komagataeibacter kakiaceti]